MLYVPLGTTNLRVSALCLGTWALGGDWGRVDEDQAHATVGHALDTGINFFDTAQAYGFGLSERVLADAEWEAFRPFTALETLQPPYHLFRRGIEADILPYCAAHGMGVMVYGPLAHGLLSGAMTAATTFAADDWRSHSRDFSGERFTRNLAVVDQLRGFAAERGMSLVELAVAWTLSHPAVDCAIVGARRPDQLSGSIGAADVKLTEED